ncbi:uncharacterized protein PAC_13757 [Phialocephala subalpina]|uniref:Uncharacterized protein n=1 Tax=Phialocephala subalpina TaxID=576137 RepID=A0A1L7XFP2_9HELO|nr:uncharacterized protein PAC_13757 [Phialocephala subalpina]
MNSMPPGFSLQELLWGTDWTMDSIPPQPQDLPAIPRLFFTDLVPVVTRTLWVEPADKGYDTRQIFAPPSFPRFEHAFGKWQELLEEAVDLMLEFMLVSAEPITNPWIQKMRTMMTEHESEDTFSSNSGGTTTFLSGAQTPLYNKRVVIEYSWSKYLRPALLATCKEYHRKGTNLFDAFSEFLNFKHESLRSLYPGMTHSPMRLHLVRKLSLEDVDLRGRRYRGYLNDKLSWQFYMVNRLEAWGACPNQLVLTFDDRDEPVVSTSQVRNGYAQKEKCAEIFYSPHWNIVEPWGIVDNTFDNSWTQRWVVADRLIIRGVSQLNHNIMRSYFQDGTAVPNNPLAVLIENWFAETDFRFPESAIECIVLSKRISYIGELGGKADVEFTKKNKL